MSKQKIKELNALIQDKERSNKLQIEETDKLRNDNRELKTLLTRIYWASIKSLDTVKEHHPDVGMKLGKELHRTKIKFLKIPHRN